MRKFMILLGVQLKTMFDPVRFLQRSRRARGLTSILLLALLAAVLLAYSTYYAIFMGEILQPLGLLDFMLLSALIAGLLLPLVLGAYKMQSQLFTGRDLEMLFALPLKQWQVLLCRLVALYIENLVYLLVVMAPSQVVYGVLSGMPAGFIPMAAAVLLLSPLLPMALSGVIGFGVGALISRSRRKNLMSMILSFLVIGIVMAISFSLQLIIEYIQQNGQNLLQDIQSALPPLRWMLQALTRQDGWMLLAVIALHIVPFAAFIALLSRYYNRMSSRLRSVAKKSKQRITYNRQSAWFALWKKEVSYFFSSPIYMLNTGAGMFMQLLFAVALAVFGQQQIEIFLEMGELGLDFTPVVILILCATIALSSTSAVSLSLEGRRLWIIKSSPVPLKAVFQAKIGMNLILTLPLSLASALILALTMHIGGWTLLWLFLLPALFAVLCAMIGLVVNLYLPRLDWTNEVTVVKQSMSVLVTLAVNTLLIVLAAVVFTESSLPFALYGALCALTVAIAAACVYRWLGGRRAKALYDEL